MMYVPGETPEDRIERMSWQYNVGVAQQVEDAQLKKQRNDEDLKRVIFDMERTFLREKAELEAVKETTYGSAKVSEDTA